ncbi:hypothetical protein Tco_0652905 [Tanacetum coccineum]|uniref:Uncharacterized protein n=1 Tax=Tanacetum coccineum TaxID=301880 RepID=A0ABQ4WYU3_9ASTR
MLTPKSNKRGEWIPASIIGRKVHTYHECVQLRSANCQIGPRKADWITVKNLKEGKDKQRAGGKTDAPRDKA